MPFINIEDDEKKVQVSVSISSGVSDELENYVAWMLGKSTKMKKPLVVEKILQEAMKRDKEYQASKKAAAAPSEISAKKTKVA